MNGARIRSLWLLPIGLVALFGAGGSSMALADSASAGDLLLGPVQILDVTTGKVRSGRMLTIDGGQIIAERDFNTDAAAAHDHFVDAGGGYALPGLAEMHAHLPPRSAGEDHVRDVLALYLVNGITTIRGMLGEPWHLELRALLESGAWVGPRLVTSGPSFNGRTVTTPEQAAARVTEQAAAGYDFLKIHPGISAATFERLALTAAQAGIPFAGHVPADVGLQGALRFGQRTIDHLDGYAEAMLPPGSPLEGQAADFFGVNLGAGLQPERAAALARATVEADVWNVPTQSLLENVIGPRAVYSMMQRADMRYVTPQRAQEWRAAVERVRSRFSAEQREGLLQARRTLLVALQDAGAGLLLGSDAPQIMNVPGFSIHEELVYLVAAGLTPLQALQSGTLQVARFFGDVSTGALGPGQAADLVVLAGNPAEDIAATRKVIGVLRGGTWYGREWIERRLDEIAQTGI